MLFVNPISYEHFRRVSEFVVEEDDGGEDTLTAKCWAIPTWRQCTSTLFKNMYSSSRVKFVMQVVVSCITK
jgi:hypothetical protein